MSMFWIILVAAISLALLIFLVRQNMKDEQEFTEQLKRDYPHAKNEEGDVEIDEVKK